MTRTNPRSIRTSGAPRKRLPRTVPTSLSASQPARPLHCHAAACPSCRRSGPAFAPALRVVPSRPFGREICNQMPNPSISAPPPRSYRLWRHFPRHCDVTTRVLHPYKPRFLRESGHAALGLQCRTGISTPSGTGRASCSFPTGLRPQNPDSVSGPSPPARTVRCNPGDRFPAENGFSDTGKSGIRKYYQLAFVTPGIRPFEAISRNWIRLMPNRRM